MCVIRNLEEENGCGYRVPKHRRCTTCGQYVRYPFALWQQNHINKATLLFCTTCSSSRRGLLDDLRELERLDQKRRTIRRLQDGFVPPHATYQ